MIEEIEAGLKNAIERGETLDSAVQTFITAGYNPVEVKEAANNISSGASSIVQSKSPGVKITSSQPKQKQVSYQNPQGQQENQYSSETKQPTPDISSSQGQPNQEQPKPENNSSDKSSTTENDLIKSKRNKALVLIGLAIFLIIILVSLLFFYKEDISIALSDLLK